MNGKAIIYLYVLKIVASLLNHSVGEGPCDVLTKWFIDAPQPMGYGIKKRRAMISYMNV
ncbi:unnamed protein product [Sphenostylis stenocarpa]|uniref:Uncharacterized protein n=1 Tax=Sphenostylis stenocarpa TaxID=92480 RepID=A0AA86T098_9FABA|nr:unnamed protein product [Sphenostylis stenocarpa]